MKTYYIDTAEIARIQGQTVSLNKLYEHYKNNNITLNSVIYELEEKLDLEFLETNDENTSDKDLSPTKGLLSRNELTKILKSYETSVESDITHSSNKNLNQNTPIKSSTEIRSTITQYEQHSNSTLLSSLLGNSNSIRPEKLSDKYSKILIESETILIGFSVFRDVFIFTDKRLIIVDVQGITGRKISYLTIPYRNISKFSVETAGTFDLDAELCIWVGSDPTPIQKKFNKKVNIYDLQKILAQYTL